MAVIYTKTFTTTCRGELLQDINDAAAITPVCEQIVYSGGSDTDFYFASSLSAGEETALDNKLAAWACAILPPPVDEQYVDDGGSPAPDVLWSSQKIDQELETKASLAAESTGILSGGLITIAANPTMFNVQAGSGVIVDNTTDPSNPVKTVVSWPATNNITPTALNSAMQTFVYVDINGNIQQQTAMFQPQDFRDKIILGVVGHENMVVIQGVRPVSYPTYDANCRVSELAGALGLFNVFGNVYSPATAVGSPPYSMSINKSAGTCYVPGSNFHIDPKSPDVGFVLANTPSVLTYIWRDGSGGWNDSGPPFGSPLNVLIDPENYDDGSGTLQSVTTDYWTTQVILLIPTSQVPGGLTFVQYAQSEHSTIEQAIESINDPNFQINFSVAQNAILRGWIVVKQGATNLNDQSQARFFQAPRFGTGGGSGSAGGGGSVISLQDAYNNSNEPEIITSTAKTAIVLRQGSSVSGNLLEFENDTPSQIGYISPQGELYLAGDILVDGTVDGRDIASDGSTQDSHIADLSIHRELDDGSTTTTNLWSASKIQTELNSKPDSLDDLSDVNLTSPATNSVLTYNGSQWIDSLITTGDMVAVQIRRTTAFSNIPTSWADVTFNTTDIENDAAILEHDNTNTDRILIKQSGLYQLHYNFVVDEDAQARLRINDSTVIPGSEKRAGDPADSGANIENIITCTCYRTLTAGQFVTLQVQGASASENIIANTATFAVVKLQGPKGDPGTGGSISIQKDDSTINASTTTLNFEGSLVSAVDEGSGKTTVTVATPTQIFGSQFQQASSDGVSSTTSGTFQQKLNMTTPSLPSGTYRISWCYEATTSGFFGTGNQRVQINNSTTVSETTSGATYVMFSGFTYQSLSGINNIDIDYSTNSGTTSIRRARIELWRVS